MGVIGDMLAAAKKRLDDAKGSNSMYEDILKGRTAEEIAKIHPISVEGAEALIATYGKAGHEASNDGR